MKDFDSRTALSASSTLRPRLAATERIRAAVSFSIFFIMVSSGLPISITGWAAPALVPGAMAAMSAASRMKIPAEPARAAGRSHVDDDRHGRGYDLVDDFAGRFDQSAGSVEFDQDGLVVVGGGKVERAADVFGGDGLDGVVYGDLYDIGEGKVVNRKSAAKQQAAWRIQS